MAFHLSPFSPYVVQAFKNNPAGLMKNRVPIAQRAARVWQDYCSATIVASHSGDFNVNGNDLKITTLGTPNFEDRYADQVFHLAFPFAGTQIVCSTRRHGDRYYISMDSPPPAGLSSRMSRQEIGKPLGGFISIELIEGAKVLQMDALTSSAPGLGGRLISSAYNVALSLGFGSIFFQVREDNFEAKQFYIHTDFGAPTSMPPMLIEWRETWRVEVK